MLMHFWVGDSRYFGMAQCVCYTFVVSELSYFSITCIAKIYGTSGSNLSL